MNQKPAQPQDVVHPIRPVPIRYRRIRSYQNLGPADLAGKRRAVASLEDVLESLAVSLPQLSHKLVATVADAADEENVNVLLSCELAVGHFALVGPLRQPVRSGLQRPVPVAEEADVADTLELFGPIHPRFVSRRVVPLDEVEAPRHLGNLDGC